MSAEKSQNPFQLGIFIRGLLMGAADVVPGVSGGTVAFITGIYQTLLDSISSVDAQAVKLLLKGQFKAFWQHVNGAFLVPLAAGIFTSIITLANIVSYLLDSYPVVLWAFFFGLISASVWVMGRQVERWNSNTILAFMLGTLMAYWVTVAHPIALPQTPLMIFIAGMIAICAMILPGISGSFLLLLMGMYGPIIGAVKAIDLSTIGLFGAGCILGLACFSRFLSWLFNSYRSITMALLTGFLLGSLNKVWPWKYTLSYRVNSKGEEVPLLQQNLLPGSYEQLGAPAYTAIALGVLIAGAAIVLWAERANR